MIRSHAKILRRAFQAQGKARTKVGEELNMFAEQYGIG